MNVAVSVALYGPFGIAGIVVGTAAGSLAMTLAQAYALRRELHGRLEARETIAALAHDGGGRGAGVVVLRRVVGARRPARARHRGPDRVRRGGLALGATMYASLVLAFSIPEAEQIRALVAGRLPRRGGRSRSGGERQGSPQVRLLERRYSQRTWG